MNSVAQLIDGLALFVQSDVQVCSLHSAHSCPGLVKPGNS
jgi:hypothetical protein